MNTSVLAVRSLRLSALCARIPGAAKLGPGTFPRRNLNIQSATDSGRLRTIDDLPGPSTTTTLHLLFIKGYADKQHLLQGIHKNTYGPIWLSKFGPLVLVNVASPEFIAQVVQQEGRYPVRAKMPHWKEYLDMRGQAYGLHVCTGTEWYQIRKHLNPKLLKLGEVSAFASSIHEVVGDMLRRIEFLRWHSPDQATVPDVAVELYKFGFEAVSSVLFETRLGCLEENIPPDTLTFISAVNSMLGNSDMALMLPRWSRSILPFWKRFVQAWDDLCTVGEKLITKRMKEIEGQVSRGEPVDGLFLTHLLSKEELTEGELYITLTELLLGGVDTTSNTLTWTLYHLARDQRAQQLLYQEVNSMCPDRREPNMEDLKTMPYLRAVIKETLRLYPVVPGNARYITENDVIVGDYWFPKETLFHLCHFAITHDESQFPNAEEFIPERWLRHQASNQLSPGSLQHKPYSYMPFGVGVRACVGKRVAELEMHFALSRLIQQYTIQPEEGAPTVHPKTRVLMVPEKPINLRFIPRAA